MAETYCGKSCDECKQKEILNCPGCNLGPGRETGGDCELAKCCRSKGHESCDTCGFKGNCTTFQKREQQPEDRIKRMESEQKQKELLAKNSVVLGKWLWILFWLIVPTVIAGILKNEYMINISPVIYMIGQIISAVCSIAYGAVLIVLSSVEKQYLPAGICFLIVALANAILVIVFGASAPTWSMAITIPVAIVGLVGTYYEFSSHSFVLKGLDNELSDNWTTLWKWYIGCTMGMIGSIILMLIAPILGVIALVVAAIGIIFVSIAKLVYLYRTAKVFREYEAE